MRQFFKFLFASCLGTILALVVVFFILTGALSSLANQVGSPRTVQANSVLRLKLDQSLPELTDNIANAPLSLDPNQSSTLGIHDIARAIRRATNDSDIKGIFLEASSLQGGFATLGLLRTELEAFKKSGKFIVAHAPYYSQGAYYLSSVADSIYLAPQGLVDFRGFGAQLPFFKDMLDRLGIEMQVYYAGEFKSGTEPYRRTNMSAENRLQTRQFLDAMYATMLREIGASRNLTPEKLRELANNYEGKSAEGAQKAGLIDGIAYREAVLATLRQRLGLDKDADINFVGLNRYFQARVSDEPKTANKIAVVVAEGTILDGKSSAGSIGDETYVDIIEKLRKDESIKAVVLRVNSPGGSASASDHIWQSLVQLKAAGKPLVVSMGDYAASGGYYIAAPADSIFAEQGTITGSIGVYTVFPSVQKLLNEKMGITFDTVLTGRYSAGISPFYKLSPDEARIFQDRTDWLYQTFLSRVGEGRGMSTAQVDSIARGRVWAAPKAVQIGLVDKIGHLDAAVRSAAGMAQLSEYNVVFYPEPKTAWEQLFSEWTGEGEEEDMVSQRLLRNQLGDQYEQYRLLYELANTKGAQMRMPFTLSFQ